ncbi:MAG: GTPase [Lachnospiraceae bacterium]|nr:GTPase [Lachnospiraceae bacterium]
MPGLFAKNNDKVVYMINGFLDSGKTQFLKFTLSQDYFKIRGTTLLILCEEGEEEYDKELLSKTKTVVEQIEKQEDFNIENLTKLEKQWRPERIVIEYNGMWDNKNLTLPDNWKVEQQITMIDANTFPMYFNNMKSMVAEMVRKSELIIFNRCDDVMDSLASYRRNIKAVNPGADVVFENSEGEVNEIFEEDLPYELNQPVIELNDNSFGIWYMDMMDHLERYEGKDVTYIAQVLKPEQFPSGYFVPGRLAMTCCAEDMAFIGYVCKYDSAAALKNKEWVKVTATVTKGSFPTYKEDGPVLVAKTVERTSKPENEIIGFS